MPSNSSQIAQKPTKNRGTAFHSKGDHDRAIADFDIAIPLKPDEAVVYFNRGLALAMKRDKDNAIADFKKALALSSDSNLRQAAEKGLREWAPG